MCPSFTCKPPSIEIFWAVFAQRNLVKGVTATVELIKGKLTHDITPNLNLCKTVMMHAPTVVGQKLNVLVLFWRQRSYRL